MILQAELLPLKGKYYGTKVALSWGGHTTEVEIWVVGDVPSARQLEAWGVSAEDAQEFLCDNHFETVESYEIASRLVKAVM